MSIIIGTETITKNPAFGTIWQIMRLNQETLITADGGHVTYDNGPNILIGSILIKNVSKTEGDNLRDFIKDTAIFQKTSFTIDPPAATDLGEGDGTAIATAFFNGGNDIERVFEYIAPGRYNITFPYWKKLT